MNIEELNAERVKILARIEALEKSLEASSVDSEKRISDVANSHAAEIDQIKQSLAATDALAKAKATVDGQTALHAAQDAVKGNEVAQKAAKEASAATR